MNNEMNNDLNNQINQFNTFNEYNQFNNQNNTNQMNNNEYLIQQHRPPPSSYPIPFGSVDFRNFHADFSSPVSEEFNYLEDDDDFSDDVFNFHL